MLAFAFRRANFIMHGGRLKASFEKQYIISCCCEIKRSSYSYLIQWLFKNAFVVKQMRERSLVIKVKLQELSKKG